MSKRIPLSRGKWALISDEDFERVNAYKWCCDRNGYACRMVHIATVDGIRSRRKVMLHRFILDAPVGMEVDHANHNKLDNRRVNIRLATKTQNRANARPRTTGSSKYKGVSWHRRDGGWCAGIHINSATKFLGVYKDEAAAARVYDAAAYAAWGDYAFLNFPQNKQFYQLALTIPKVPRSLPLLTTLGAD
jgi:hypothetical protein